MTHMYRNMHMAKSQGAAFLHPGGPAPVLFEKIKKIVKYYLKNLKKNWRQTYMSFHTRAKFRNENAFSVLCRKKTKSVVRMRSKTRF